MKKNSFDEALFDPGERPPEEVRADGNRLSGENSLYLKQHANNPVEWFPYGDEAVELARRLDRPIFLSIGYSSCHWCHVMEKEVFEHDDVAAILNERFIAIKVDREERPDIDAAYMEAVIAMTGGGGWPMSVFLNGDLRPFFSATYIPKPNFIALAHRIDDIYRNRRDEVERGAEEVYRVLKGADNPTPGEISADRIDRIAEKIGAASDIRYGGLSGTQKFPTPSIWSLVLNQYRRVGGEIYSAPLLKTLDNMAAGGIRDHIGGGFMRYTVEPSWTVPHFEKMLYDNAQLASLYTEAAATFGRDDYAEIARDTLDFMVEDFTGDEGGFYSSYDADSEEGEGAYYVWTFEQLAEIAGPESGEILAKYLGFTREGNFEGKNIPTRRSVGRNGSSGPINDRADELWREYRPILKSTRSLRPAPALDKKIITAWNGMAISAMARGYLYFDDDRYLAAAENAADYLLSTHRRQDGGLYRAGNSGVPIGPGVLEDYAAFSLGLLDLFQASAKSERLRQALELIDYMTEKFQEPSGLFYLTAAEEQAPLGRRRDDYDGATPSGPSLAIRALAIAAAITEKEIYRKKARTALEADAQGLIRAGLNLSYRLDAAAMIDRLKTVMIFGSGKLLEEYRTLLPVDSVLVNQQSTEVGAELNDLIPATKKDAGEEDRAYICRPGTCLPPVTDREEFSRILAGRT